MRAIHKAKSEGSETPLCGQVKGRPWLLVTDELRRVSCDRCRKMMQKAERNAR